MNTATFPVVGFEVENGKVVDTATLEQRLNREGRLWWVEQVVSTFRLSDTLTVEGLVDDLHDQIILWPGFERTVRSEVRALAQDIYLRTI